MFVGDEEVAVMGDRARDVDDVLRVRLWNRGQRRGVVYDLDGAGHDFSKRLPKSPENWFLWSDLTEVPFAFVQHLSAGKKVQEREFRGFEDDTRRGAGAFRRNPREQNIGVDVDPKAVSTERHARPSSLAISCLTSQRFSRSCSVVTPAFSRAPRNSGAMLGI